MNPTEIARRCAEELGPRVIPYWSFQKGTCVPVMIEIIQQYFNAYTAELKAENERLKKSLESESKGTLIVEVHRLKKALEKANENLSEQDRKVGYFEERERELVKDKERLDWLQQGHGVLCLINYSTLGQGYHFEVDEVTNNDLREAIDKAKAALKGEG